MTNQLGWWQSQLHQMNIDLLDADIDEFTPAKLDTYTDERGVMWQVPYDDGSGESLKIFNALMTGRVIVKKDTVTVSYTYKYGFTCVPHEVKTVTVYVRKLNDMYSVTTWGDDGMKEQQYFPSQTYEMLLGLVGYGWDFSGCEIQ